MVLPHTDAEGAMVLMERIRSNIADIEIPTGGEALRFTVSIGVAEIAPETEVIEAAIQRADTALYASKRDGRNRVTFDEAA